MHTGQSNPHSVTNEYISGQIVSDPNNNKYVFPSLNVSKILLPLTTMHILIQKPKIELAKISGARSMTVQDIL